MTMLRSSTFFLPTLLLSPEAPSYSDELTSMNDSSLTPIEGCLLVLPELFFIEPEPFETLGELRAENALTAAS